MYLEIGRKIAFEVVEMQDFSCKGCFFNDHGCTIEGTLYCSSIGRDDGKSVIFKEIKL